MPAYISPIFSVIPLFLFHYFRHTSRQISLLIRKIFFSLDLCYLDQRIFESVRNFSKYLVKWGVISASDIEDRINLMENGDGKTKVEG